MKRDRETTMGKTSGGSPDLPEIIIENTDKTDAGLLSDSLHRTRAALRNTPSNRERAQVSILVFAYNNLQKHTRYCIDSILRYTRDIDYELVLLDNGSTDGTFEYFKGVPHSRKKIVRITENKGANYGQYAATRYLTGRYVVMIANDVYVTENWLANMIKCAESDERFGFLATFSDNVSNLQALDLSFESLDEMRSKAARYNVSDPRKWEERLRLMPAIAFYKRECLDIIGSLDYAFQHDFSDDDISFRVRRAGYKLICCGDVFVHHSGSSAAGSSEAKMAVLRRGREKFRQKYFGIDGWEDINNFELLMLNLVNPEEMRGRVNPEVLGIDVRCGTPILQLKNKLRLADIFDTTLSAFVQDPKYWLDLKTICDGTVAVDRIEHLTDHFSPRSFDYILLGNPVDSYSQTGKILADLLSLLKSDGQLLIKIENRFDAKTFLGSGGKDPGPGHHIVPHTEIDDLKRLILRQGGTVKSVVKTLQNIDAAEKEAIGEILRNAGKGQNCDAAFNDLMTQAYALKITLRAVNPDEHPADSPLTSRKTPPGAIIGERNSRGQGEDEPSADAPLFPCFQRPEAVPGLTSIVILACNRLDRTKRCIKAIRRHTPEPHEIIFVDNGSTDGTLKWLHRRARENNHYRLIENHENAGVAKGRNQGIALSRGEYLLLLDNDTVVSPGWLCKMRECLNRRADAAIVGPMTNGSAGLQRVADESYRSVDDLDQYAENFTARYRYRQISHRNIAGFCMLFKRDLTKRIGLFDERLGAGRLEDEDFCLRATLAGFRNYIAGDVFIHHDPGQGPPCDRKRLEQKWTLSTATPAGKQLSVVRATEVAEELHGKGKTAEAVEALINGLKLTPEAPEIYCSLARMFIEAKQFSEAWEVVASMPDALRKDRKGLECAGYAREGLGMDEDAAADVERMLSLDGNDPAALNLHGLLALKQGDREKAADDFNKAIQADSGYAEAYTNLGVLHWEMDRQEEGIVHLRKGFILSPTVPDTGSLYHLAASSRGLLSDAEADFQEAANLYPENRNLAFLHIDLLIRQEKFASAILKIEDSLALFGLDEGTLNAALAVRERIGPLHVDRSSGKSNLTLCMIVKNEERHLVKCLKSVRDIVDEMIIVDTGSSDKTRKIATVFGAKVFDFPWTGDFSAARNHSLVQATGDWILILDADEVIAAGDYGELKALIRTGTSSPAAFSLVTRNYTSNVSVIGWTRNQGQYPEEAGAGWVASAKVRLFPRREDIFFSDPVHEMVEHTLKKARIPIRTCNVVVHHYGKLDMDKDTQKGESYFLLGKMKHESDPTNVQYLNELAKQAQVLDRYEEAVELWLKLLALIEGKPDSSSYREMSRLSFGEPVSEVYIQLASAYLMLDRYEEALEIARRAMEINRVRPKEHVHIYAHCEIIVGSLDRAMAALSAILETTPDYTPALFLKAVVCSLDGRREEGQEIFQTLRQKDVAIEPALKQLVKHLLAHGRSDRAERLAGVASAR